MTRSRIQLAALVLLTPLAFVVMLVVTAFVACGISGCGGGGFGPSFSPRQAQVSLLACGATLLPLVLWLMRGRPLHQTVPAAVAVVAAGALLAVSLTGIGPNGCPVGQSQARGGPTAFSPDALTCSADRDAVGRR